MPRKCDRHVKPVRAKGALYLYFDTGRVDERGKRVHVRLPDPSDKAGYGRAYASLLAARSRRDSQDSDSDGIKVPHLVRLFQLSQTWRGFSEGTREVYTIYLRRFSERLSNAPAAEVASKDLIQLMDEMGATPGAANLWLGAIGGLYKWARKRRHVAAECRPTANIDRFSLGEHEPWPEHVLEAALKAEDRQVRLATHLLYYTAQRLNDMRRMRWSDVSDGCIQLVQEKTDKRLLVPLHDALKAELERTPRQGLFILANETGGRPTEARVRADLQKFASRMGAKVVPHGLRKNAVNSLLEAGCTVAETAAISGQSLQMVEHYAKQRNTTKLGSAAILKWNAA